MVRFRDDFGGPWICKNEQKCGSVCSKSLFDVRNIRSISGAFWARFWEGLGSILGGCGASRAKNRRSRAVCKRRRKRRRKKSKKSVGRGRSGRGRRNGGSRWETTSREPMSLTRPAPRRQATGGGGSHSPSGLTTAAPGDLPFYRGRVGGMAGACERAGGPNTPCSRSTSDLGRRIE